MHQPPLWTEQLLTILVPSAKNESQESVNNVCEGPVSYTAMNCIALWLNWILCGQSSQYVLVYNFTNMHAMSHRSELFACSWGEDIFEPAVCFTVSSLSEVFRVRLPSFLILTTMSDSESLNTSLLEVMITSNNELVFILDLSDLTLQMIFNAWWVSMNVDWKGPNAWYSSRHAPSWWFNFHCRFEETGSHGIICIICHQVLHHPSEKGTSSMGEHFLAQAHITKFNGLTESEVTELTSSKVDKTALAILKIQGSWGITMVNSLRKIIIDLQVNPYWPKWQTKHSKWAGEAFETSEFHQDAWNRYLMLGFVSAYIPWNAILNLDLWRSYEALRNDLVLPSGMTLRNIFWRESPFTVDAIEKEMLSQNEATLALDR